MLTVTSQSTNLVNDHDAYAFMAQEIEEEEVVEKDIEMMLDGPKEHMWQEIIKSDGVLVGGQVEHRIYMLVIEMHQQQPLLPFPWSALQSPPWQQLGGIDEKEYNGCWRIRRNTETSTAAAAAATAKAGRVRTGIRRMNGWAGGDGRAKGNGGRARVIG